MRRAIYLLSLLVFFGCVSSDVRKNRGKFFEKVLANKSLLLEAFAFRDINSHNSTKNDSILIRAAFPYSNLVFLNEGSFWKADFSIEFSIYDSTKTRLLQRFFVNDSVSVKNRAHIKEKSRLFAYCFVKNKNFDDNIFYVSAKLSDKNSTREYFSSFFLNTVRLPLLAIRTKNELSSDYSSVDVISLGSYLFFDETENDIIYFSNFADSNLRLIVKQFNRIVDTLNAIKLDTIDFGKNEYEKVCLIKDALYGKHKYLFKNVNKKLYEGNVNLIFISNEQKIDSIRVNVFWLEKPSVLNNPILIRKATEKILSQKEIQELNVILRRDTTLLSLFAFWNRKYPSKRSFNKHMYEFYKRADEAIEKFSTPGTFDGIDKDMGAIYLIYGEPDKKDRYLIERNKTIEIWEYSGINLKFKFVDYSGSGEFKLEK